MECFSFAIRGEASEHLSFHSTELFGFPDKTSHWGGYEVKGTVSIRASGYQATGELWTTTGEIHTFATSLKEAFRQLKGKVDWTNYERNLHLELHFMERGHVQVSGSFQEYPHVENVLRFAFEMDQSFLLSTLTELEEIIARYGGPKGIIR
ncbi:MAG: DUF6228 family protein [Flavobacteriales bacterium]